MYCAEGQARVALEQEKLEFCRLVPAFLALSASQQAQYLDLVHHSEDGATGQAVVAAFRHCCHLNIDFSMFARVCWVYRANTFNDGLYPVLAQLNHSCLPNTEIVRNEESNTRDLVALADIEEGTEICHNYLHNCFHFEDRRQTLLKKWNFVCECCLCFAKQDQKLMVRLSNACIHPISEEDLDSLESLCDFREVRVTFVLKATSIAYQSYGINSKFLKKIILLGVQCSELLYGSDHEKTKIWLLRLNQPNVFKFKQYSITFAKFVFSVFTFVILFWNFWLNNHVQLLMIICAVLSFAKT